MTGPVVPPGGEDELREALLGAICRCLGMDPVEADQPEVDDLMQHLIPVVLADRERHARQAAADEKLPPVGLRPRWLANEMRAAEITAAIGRYEAAGADVPAEWRDELDALSSAEAPARPADPVASLQDFLR